MDQNKSILFQLSYQHVGNHWEWKKIMCSRELEGIQRVSKGRLECRESREYYLSMESKMRTHWGYLMFSSSITRRPQPGIGKLSEWFMLQIRAVSLNLEEEGLLSKFKSIHQHVKRSSSVKSGDERLLGIFRSHKVCGKAQIWVA